MGTYYKQGLEEDIKGNYKEAIDLYFKSVEAEELELDAYLNLIGILIEASLDFGVSSDLINKGVYTQDELNALYESLGLILKKAEISFDSNEVVFWKYYKENYFTGIDIDKIKEIIKKDDLNLVPYFQLYIDDLVNGNEVLLYTHKIKELKIYLLERQTIKNRYILSLIESAENQRKNLI